MTSAVLDASAILAVIFREPGADVVGRHMDAGAVCAVNYAEVLAKVVARGSSIEDAVRQLARFSFTTIAFEAERAAIAASLRQPTQSLGLSLADRACLALGLKSGLPILTADQKWAKLTLPLQIELIR